MLAVMFMLLLVLLDGSAEPPGDHRERDFVRGGSRRPPAFCQRRKPPRNALALAPARHPGGNSFSFLTLPPPTTTSSGSKAALRRPTTSATWRRHFRFPCFSK